MGHVKVSISSIEDLWLDAFKFGEKQGGGCNTVTANLLPTAILLFHVF
jgi:hypothetical protein|tara:strand:+ start:188 stop:331 length:144 start_codon:yes stop_codon:yes gene_type:complete